MEWPLTTFELRYQDVLACLARAEASPRWVEETAQLLTEIAPHWEEAEPYLLDLAERLPLVSDPHRLAGVSPCTVRALVETLEAARAAVGLLREIEHLEEVLAHLRRAAALLYAFVGAWREAALVLGACDAPQVKEALDLRAATSDGAAEGASSVSHGLLRLSLALRSTAPAAAWHLRALRDRHEAWLDATTGSVHIPVVERSALSDTDAPYVTAHLRMLRLDLQRRASGEGDHVRTNVIVFGATTGPDAWIDEPLRCARRHAAAQTLLSGVTAVEGRVLFSHPHLLHEGRSAGAALAVLFYSHLLRLARGRRRAQLPPSMAMTGRVDPSGHLQPVDADTLGEKMRAVFFSGITCLVVPQAQLEAAEEAVAALRERYPQRTLCLVGESTVAGLLSDRRLLQEYDEPLPSYLARQASGHLWSIASAVVIMALLAVVLGFLHARTDPHPETFTFQGEMLVVENASGHTLARIPVGQATVDIAQRQAPRMAVLGDLDDDGMKDVVYVEHASHRSGKTDRVVAYSLAKGARLWSYLLVDSLRFARKPGLTDQRYKGRQVDAGDLDGDGQAEVYVRANHYALFPALLLKLDGRTGRLQQRYLHPGRLEMMGRVDLDRDGRDELVLTGTNNAFDAAVLVVLAPGDIGGHGPATGDYVAKGVPPATHVAYVRIPATKLGEALRYVSPRPMGTKVRVDQAKPSVTAVITDGRLHNRDLLRVDQALYHLHFDAGLEAYGYGTHDSYDLLTRWLIDEGHLEAPFDHDDFVAFKGQVRYWNGTGWQREPFVDLGRPDPSMVGAP